MDMNTVRNVGGIGALILVLSPIVGLIPVIGGLINLVGVIMVIVAMYGLSQHYKSPDIFKNYLIGLVVVFVGTILAVVLGGASLLSMGMIGTQEAAGIFGGLIAFISSVLLAFAVLWVGAIIGSFFMRKALLQAAEVTKNENFKWAGNLFLIGSVLLIILIGGVVSWVGAIFLALAFFGLKK